MGPVMSAPADDILRIEAVGDLFAPDDKFRIDEPRSSDADLGSGVDRIDLLPTRSRPHLQHLLPVFLAF